MARASRAQSEITASTVLETAAEMFAKQGFAGVSLNGVAEAIGLTRGAVYHHFGNKHALFAAVVTRAHEEVAAAIDEATPDELSEWEQLECGSMAFLKAITNDRVSRILLIDGPAVLGWSAWRENDKKTSQAALADVLTRLADSGEIHAANVDAATILLSGAMNEAALWLARDDAMEKDWHRAELVLRAMIRSLKST